jgi:hypothetical protein
MEWPPVERSDPGIAKVRLEHCFEAVEFARERQPVIRQHSCWHAPHQRGLTERGPRLNRGWMLDGPGTHQHPGVIIDRVEHTHRTSRDDPLHEIDLPPFVWAGCLEPDPRRLWSLVRLRSHQTPTHQNPMDRRHRRHPTLHRGIPLEMPAAPWSDHDPTRRRRALCVTPRSGPPPGTGSGPARCSGAETATRIRPHPRADIGPHTCKTSWSTRPPGSTTQTPPSARHQRTPSPQASTSSATPFWPWPTESTINPKPCYRCPATSTATDVPRSNIPDTGTEHAEIEPGARPTVAATSPAPQRSGAPEETLPGRDTRRAPDGSVRRSGGPG